MEKTRHAHKHPAWGPVIAIAATLGIFFGAQLIVGVAIYLALYGAGWPTERIDAWLVSGNSVQFGISLAVGLTTLTLLHLFLRSRKASFRDIGLLRPRLRDVGWALLGLGAYIVLYIVTATILARILPGLDMEQAQDIGYTPQESMAALTLTFIGLVVLPPLVEEIMVRGFLFTGLRTAMAFLPAAVISSLLFGLAHLPGGEGGSTIWIAFVDTMVLAMVLAYLRERTGSLWASIGLHGLKNLIAFMALFVFRLA